MATTAAAAAATTAKTNSSATPPVDDELLFVWPDYLVFAISLAIPLGIGVFFFLYKRKEQTGAENFLVGDRSMNFVAVALSILASLLNGIFVIGTPAEMHYYGTELTYVVIGLLLAIVITAHLFIPKYQTMKFTSAYEYVEKRFNYPTRVVASAIFCLSVIIFLAVVLYVPALAFAQVTKLHIGITIAVTGAICTVYTTIGGIKAVVWTDAVQMIILLVGLIVIAALGSVKVGGGQAVWDIAVSTFRINYDDFRIDPRIRHTFWSQTIGQGFMFLGLFISNQMMVQRYMSVATGWQAKAALYIAFFMFIPLVILVLFIGLAMHATYNSCDPLVRKKITAGDQITPYYILDVLGEFPGVPGLITASVFAAALSSVSSVINALAAVCLEDFISPAVVYYKHKDLTDQMKRYVAIVIVIFFGGLTIGLSFAASYFTDKVVQATGTIWGVIGGPLAGIFIMGFFMPFCNSAGAICGMVGGLIFSLWVAIGNIIYAPKEPTLPVGICRGNLTMSLPLPVPNATVVDFSLMDLYTVSYAWYGLIGIGSSVIIGVVMSLLTGGWRRTYMVNVDPAMMNIGWCKCCAPIGQPRDETKSEKSDDASSSYDAKISAASMPDIDNCVTLVGIKRLSESNGFVSVSSVSITEEHKKAREASQPNGVYSNMSFTESCEDIYANNRRLTTDAEKALPNGKPANGAVKTAF